MSDEPKLLRRGRRVRVFVVVTLVVIALDQLTKVLVRSLAPEPRRIGRLIPGLLDLVRVENTGAAFSLGEGAGALFVLVALAVALLAFVITLKADLPLPLVVALACVAGGGLGNMIDRLLHGSVTDFLATTFVSFPVFNVADIFVTCGTVAGLMGYLAWEARQERR